MATRLLQLGVIEAIAQNEVCALPTRRCLFFTDATTPTIQQSLDPAFGTNAALTLTSGQAEVAGAYIRCTTAGINVIVKGN